MASINENARSMKFSLYITFLDLANVFGSLSHQLIHNMLTHIQLPPPVEQYLGDMYSKLQVFVFTPDWNTAAFAIQLWVLQGETISIIIFSTALTLWSSWLTSNLLEITYHIFPYQTQNHCLPLISLSICYGTWNLHQNL